MHAPPYLAPPIHTAEAAATAELLMNPLSLPFFPSFPFIIEGGTAAAAAVKRKN